MAFFTLGGKFETMTTQRYPQREFLKLTSSLLGTKMFPWSSVETKTLQTTRPRKLGTTFSQLQCQYLDLNYQETFHEISTLGFDYIRLCVYWNEVEPIQGRFNFTTLDWLIEECRKHSLEVVLAVGMKAPRWPEFHFPEWIKKSQETNYTDRPMDSDKILAELALKFVERVAEHLQDIPIAYWQVENEALSKPGVAGGRYLSKKFVQQEVDLVKTIRPEAKILLTNSVSMLPIPDDDQQALEDSIPLADAIGFNVYTKVPLSKTTYLEVFPFYWEKLAEWKNELIKYGKEPWIAEAQAEPWEWNQLVAIKQPEYPSASPDRMTTLVSRLSQMDYQTVLLWGCEYWVWNKKQGNPEWLETVRKLVQLKE